MARSKSPIQYPPGETPKGPTDEALGNVLVMLRSRVSAVRRRLRKDQAALNRDCATIEDDLTRLVEIMYRPHGDHRSNWQALRRQNRSTL